MITLKLTDKELMALKHCLSFTYKDNHHNWNDEIEAILKQLKG